MSLIFKESNPYSPTGWVPYSIIKELPRKKTPLGITMPEYKGVIQSIVFDSRDNEGESIIYLASPIANFIDTGDIMGDMQSLARLRIGESYYFAADDYIEDDAGFDYYPLVVRVTQT